MTTARSDLIQPIESWHTITWLLQCEDLRGATKLAHKLVGIAERDDKLEMRIPITLHGVGPFVTVVLILKMLEVDQQLGEPVLARKALPLVLRHAPAGTRGMMERYAAKLEACTKSGAVA